MAAIPARDRSGSIKTWAERTTSGPTSPVALNSFTQTMEPAAASQDDAEWKQIQKKVFTRWCNERLKVVNIEVTQLPEDFSDGIKVINLVQVLSKKMIGRYSKKPRMYAQKMENVDLALKFLTKVEKIKIVNIGSGDIVNGNLKLTLGLIWTLILHYQISVGFKIDDKKGSSSAKQVLAEYVQEFIPHLKVTNFTVDWNDGRMIAALVDGTAPGLCPEAYTMTQDNPLENATHAMTLAQDWLGIPMVLLPEDMVNPNVDALSVITYVSQFPEAELKPGAPIKEGGDPLKVKAYGDGLKAEGLAVSSSHVKFHVDVSEAKPFGSLRVKITGPNKMEIHSDVAYENDVYTYSYLPGEEGKYTIDILWWGKPIANSPFIVDVVGVSKRGSLPRQVGKVEAIKVYGPGIEGRDLRAKEPAEFWVEGVPSNMTIQVRVKGPKGQLGSNFIKVEQVKKTKYVVYYYPMVAGEYSVNVSAGSKAVASSPYTVNIAEEAAVQVVGWARGPGLEGIDMEAGKSTWFYVFIPTGLVKDISISIEGPKGKVTASSEKALESIYKFTYIPKQNGEYRIVITIGPKGRQLITLHFMVIVPSSAASAAGICKVWGTGVTPRGIQVNQRVQIHVQPTVKSDSETVTMKITSGDKEIPAEMEEVNGVYTFSYCPPSTGKSSIEVFYGGNPLPNSPFIVNITDVSKIAISGLKAVLPIKQQLKLDVDASLAGSGALAIMPAEGNKKVISPKVTDKKDGFFEITLSPVKPCEEELIFTFDDVPLAQNPVILNFIDPSKVKVNGRGIQNGNVVDKPTYFMVDTTEAGIGDVGVELNGPVPTIVEISPSSEDKEGIFKCQYTPTQPGKYSADVTFSGIPTEDSPYEFEVKPVGETAQIAVYGSALESGLVVGTPSEFFIDLGDETPNNVEVYVESPAGEVCVTEQPLEDAITQYSFPVYQPGPYNFDIKIDDKPVNGSPFQSESVFPKDVPKVTVSGSGIEEAFVDETAEFEIDFHREGSGALSVSIDGPTKVEPEVTGGPNGTASVKYLPDTKGDYEIKVQFDDKEIAGCPFPVKVKSRDESETIKLEATGVKLGTDFQYNVDLSQANTTDALTGKVVGPFKLKKGKVPKKFLSNDTTLSSFPGVVGSDYTVVEPTVTEKDQIYSVQFTPDEVGVYVAYVFLGERLLDSMPYEISVCDPSQITVKGKGLNTDERESCYVNDPLKWEVDCTKAGPGTLTAYVAGPNKCSKKFKIKETSDDEYDVTYKPKQPGSYQMLFAYSGFDLPQKPTLMVSDPSKAQLKDSGMKICRVGEKVSFPVDLSTAGAGRLQANLEGPVEVPIEFTKNDDGTCVFSFTPTDVGKYALNVSFGDTPLSGEPMEVTAVDFDKVNLSGSGFNGLGTKVNQPATVTVDCTGSGVAPLNATLTTPNETVLPLEFTPIDEAIFEAQYTPDEIGHHKLDVEFAGEPVKGSPFDVPIADPNKVKLSLPETLHAVPGETCQIEAFTESAGPGTISGVLSAPGTTDEPTPATVKPLDTEGNHYEVDFDIPPKPGVYQALVCYNDLPVCSPIEIFGGADFATMEEAVMVESAPVESLPDMFKSEAPVVALGSDFQYDVEADTTDAVTGKVVGPFKTENVPDKFLSKDTTLSSFPDVVGSDYTVVEPTVTEKDQIYSVQFTPDEVGIYVVDVFLGERLVDNMPLKINVVDPTKVKVYGRGLRDGNVADKPTSFIVNTTEAGIGDVGVELNGPAPTQVNVSSSPDKPGIFKCRYTPTQPGEYTANVSFSDIPTEKSPYKFKVNPAGQPVPLTIYGPALESDLVIGTPSEFFIDLGDETPNDVEVYVESPAGEVCVTEQPLEDAITQYSFPVYQPGPYNFDIKIDDKSIEGFPVQTESDFPKDVPKVAVSGSGIEEAFVDETAEFEIDFHREGSGALSVSIDGPTKVQPEVTDGPNGTASVKYLPDTKGDYEIKVQFDDKEIAGCPFPVKVKSRDESETIKLEATGVKLGTDFQYNVDLSQANTTDALTGKVVGPFKLKKGKVPKKFLSNDTTLSSFPGVVGSDYTVVEPTVTEKDQIYSVQFTPDEVGVYVAYVFLGERLLDSMPYEISVCDPSQITVKGKGLNTDERESCYVNDPLKWEVDCTKAGPGTLTAYVAGPNKCSKKFKIKETSDDEYDVTYKPKQPGSYQMLFAYSGFDLPQKPTLMVSDPSKAQLKDSGMKICRVGEKVSFPVDLSSAGAGRLQANLEGPVEVPIEFTKNDDGTCVFSFTPTDVGKYALNVSFGDTPLSGEPMEVTAVDFDKVNLSGSGFNGLGTKVDQPATVTVDCTESGVAPLNATLTTPNETVLPLEFTPIDEAIFEAQYTPDEIGHHKLDVEFAGEPVKGSPFDVPIGLSLEAIEAELCVMEELTESAIPFELIVAEEVDLVESGIVESQPEMFTPRLNLGADFQYDVDLSQADTTDAVTGKVVGPFKTGNVPDKFLSKDTTLSSFPDVVGSDYTVVEPTVTEKDQIYSVQFTPDEVGVYVVDVFLGERLVDNMPLKINVVDPTKVKVYGRGLRDGNVADKPTSFIVNTTEAGIGDVGVELNGPAPTQVDISSSPDKPGIFKCQYTPTQPGEYTADVSFSDIPTEKSPYKFKVNPAGQPVPLTIYGPALESDLVVGTPSEFFIDLGDETPNDVEVYVESPAGEVCVTEQPLEDAITQYSFPVYQPGPYNFDIKIDDKSIEGFPVQTESDFPKDVPKVAVSGSGIEEAFVDETAEFEIDFHREGSGALSVSIDGPTKVEPEVTGGPNGTASVKYLPDTKGDYEIKVQFDDKEIAGCPFPVKVKSRDESETIKLEATGVKLGTDFQYNVDLSQANTTDALTGKVIGPFKKGKVPDKFLSNDTTLSSFPDIVGSDYTVVEPTVTEKDQIYSVQFTPDEVGVYVAYVFLGERLLDSMPYEISVCDPSQITVKGKGLNTDERESCYVNDPLKWEVDCTKAGPGTLTAYVAGPNKCSKKFKIKETSDDEYDVTYKPKQPGSYQMLFAYSGFDLPQKPTLMVSDPSKAQLKDSGMKICRVGEKVSFPVDLSSAGAGRLQANLEGPVEVPIEFTKNDDGTCVFSFTPTDIGKYALNISFGDTPLSGEPMEVTAVDVDKVNLSGSGFNGLGTKVDQPATVTVDCTESGVAPLNATLTTPNETVLPLEFTPIDEAIFEAQYIPDEIGYHKLDVEFAGEPVKGSPFDVPIADPNKVKLSLPETLHAVPGETCQIEAFTESAGPGTISGVLSAPGTTDEPTPATVKPLDTEGNHYEVDFDIPPKPGVYQALVCYNDLPVCTPVDILCSGISLELDDIDVDQNGIGVEYTLDFFLPKVVPEEVTMKLISEEQQEIPLDFLVEKIDDDNCRVKYTPQDEGVFEASLCYAGNPLCDPFNITVINPENVQISGPLTEAVKLQADTETYLTVDTTEARSVEPAVRLLTPNETDFNKVPLNQDNPGIFTAKCTPTVVGSNEIEVKCCGRPHQYKFDVFNPSLVKCTPSSPETRCNIGEPVKLEFDVSEAGNGQFNLEINGPNECSVDNTVNDEGALVFVLNPTAAGVYEVEATLESLPCREEPMKVVVLDMDKMEISGSGATGRRARVGIPVEICIDLSKSGPVPIEATVARPSGDVAPLSFLPKEDEPEFLLATYTPESSGYHTVTFTIDEELYKEPMRAYIVNPEEFQIQPTTEEPLEAIPGELNVIDLFLENGIEEDDRFEVILEDESGNESVIECKAVQVDDQHWKLEYMPEAESAKFVTLCYNEVPISEKIPIVQGSLSECTIEGIEPVVIVNQETSFTIDVTKATNRGSLSININQSDDTDIQVRIEEIDAGGVYKITYKPSIIGELSMKIKYGGLSFGKLPVVYAVDPSLVICTELNDKVVLVDEKIVFAVDTSEAGSGAELKINLEGPEGSDVSLQKVSDDNYSGVLSSSNPGACYLYITYGPGPISESPFVCGFKRPEPNAGRCQVPDMSIPGKFMVDCRDGGGNGVLEVAVYGAYVPAKYIAVEHNGDYTFNVSYDIPDPVETTISVKWHGEHLQGSPFKVVFKK